MAGFRLTGLGAGSAAGHSLRYEQLFSTSPVALLGAMDWFKGADIASAATVNLTTATGNAVHITGTTTITAVTLGSGMVRIVIFDGALTLTHHATNNNLPGAANITTAAGDRALYWSDGTTVYCVGYTTVASSPVGTTGTLTHKGAIASTGGAFPGVSATKIQSYVPSDGPMVELINSAAAANSRVWRILGFSDGNLYLQNPVDAGTGSTNPFTLTRAGGMSWGTGTANFGQVTKRKTADETVTSSVTPQDDDHLTFAIAANEEWVATFEICWTDAAAGGVRVAVTTPAGATNRFGAHLTDSSGTDSIASNGTTSGTAILAVTTSTTTGVLRVTAWVLNGATPGNVTLQWAQAVSNVTATTFLKGAYMFASRVA